MYTFLRLSAISIATVLVACAVDDANPGRSGDTVAELDERAEASAVRAESVGVVSGTWSPSLFPIVVPAGRFGLGDLVFDNNGDLLVAVSGNATNAIVRVSRTTGLQTTVASNVGTGLLDGITYDTATGMIYANDNRNIYAVTPGGGVRVLATTTISLHTLAIAPPSFGRFGGFIIAVGPEGSVIAVNPTNGAVTTITALNSARGSDLAFAPDGTLYVCEASLITRVSPTGAVTVVATGLVDADGIAITPDGAQMFIADSGTDTVVHFTLPGLVRSTFAAADIDSGSATGGIIVAPGGLLIVMTGETSLTLRAFPINTVDAFTIGGTASGLLEPGLVLQNNGGDDLAVTGNGAFAFLSPAANGAAYNVTIKAQPDGQTCTVAAGTGTVSSASITSIQVACTGEPSEPSGPSWPVSLFPIAIPGASFGLGDLVFDNNGDLLVAVSGNATNAIVRVNRVTGAQTTIARNLGTDLLDGITYDAATGMIYANDRRNIYAVTRTGGVTVLATTAILLHTLAIAPPSFGNFGGFIIAVGPEGSVIAVNPTNGAVTTITALGSARGSDLAFAPDGTLYVCEASLITKVSPTGTVTVVASGLGDADGIAITPDGAHMFVADSGTDTVIHFALPGLERTPFAAADIDDGDATGGIIVAPGGILIVMTGETSLTLRAFPL